jgi:anti-sigma regulatory factor (Ser/Thr protein kinase)
MASPEPRPGSTPGDSDLAANGVALDLRFDVDGLYALRSALLAHGSELGANENDLDRLVLVASELATNAIRHGGGAGRLRLWRDGDRIVCEVTDGGGGIFDPDLGGARVEPNAMGGRGLWICRRLADSVVIEANSPGAKVIAAFDLSSESI